MKRSRTQRNAKIDEPTNLAEPPSSKSKKLVKTNEEKKVPSVESIVVYTQDDWKKWLKKNHEKKEKVFLVSYKKHTGKDSISHRESLNLALCYGWIDTTLKRLDEDTALVSSISFQRTFVRRGDKATWSTNTLSYAKALHEAGEMSALGKQRYLEGLGRTPIDHDIDKKPDMPDGLKAALALKKNALARENFEAFSNSKKFSTYKWILRAKRDETKADRIAKIIAAAEENKVVFS